MLRAVLYPDFKGSNTLLIWGNNSDMARLSHGLMELFRAGCPAFQIEGGQGLSALQVQAGRGDWTSQISGSKDSLEWVCSPDVLGYCLGLLDPLLTSTAGHQYVDAQGCLVNQIMIAVNEYSGDFRR
jgi:hypothetical protein